MNGDFLERAQKLMLSDEFNSKVDNMINRQSLRGGKNVMESRGAMPSVGSSIAEIEMSKVIDESPGFLYSPALESEFGSKKRMTETEIKPNKVVTEMASAVSGIDYSLIKTIIDESIRRNLDDIKKEMLNENNSVRGVRIAKGNKIQLMDAKGNIYEGILKLKSRNKQ